MNEYPYNISHLMNVLNATAALEKTKINGGIVP